MSDTPICDENVIPESRSNYASVRLEVAQRLERKLSETEKELETLKQCAPSKDLEEIYDAVVRANRDLLHERDSLRSQLDAVTQELAEVKTKWPREYEKQNEALTAERDALRYAFEQLAKSLDNEADVDDGQPNDAMRFLTDLRAALAATEPSK